jgi:NADPH:quinone reductase-like Zn-dependent oxidoreductase
MGGEACNLSPASLIFRDIRLRGFWLARWFTQADADARHKFFAELVALIASGRLRAQVQSTYGIDKIRQAVAAAASGERSGKVLLLPNS